MKPELEQKIRARAQQLWEAEGRPEGRALEHWREAERQVIAAEGESWRPDGPETVSSTADPHLPADPLRNPEFVPPDSDPLRPVATGPEAPPVTPAAEPRAAPAKARAEADLEPPGGEDRRT